ncbi:MAG TPA: hypothetical protein VFJ52_08540, partial [Terriglobia bacterium]|nr:hypothetical protein [Terriglobia bacterium]
RPWYRCSPNYLDRVNITNISASRRVHVWKSYENTKRFESIRYMNRTTGISTMRHDDFAAGRNMRQAGVKVDPRQFEHVKVLAAPQPAPGNHVLIARPIAPQRPGMRERPEFINRQGMMTSTRPGAGPVKPPVRALPPASIPRGRQAVPPPSGTGTQPHGTPGAAPPRPYGRPVPAPAGNGEREAGPPNRGNQRQGAPAAPRVEKPVGRPVPAPPAAYERERGPDGRGTNQQPAQGPDVRPLGRPMPVPPARQQMEPEPQPPQQPHEQPYEREVRSPASQPPERHQEARPAPSPQKARNAEKQQKHEESKPQPNERKGRIR